MSKPKSEIIPCQPGNPDDGSAHHTCACEFVPSRERPREIYIRFDGRRVAKRGHSLTIGHAAWLPLIEGYDVVDEAPERIAVFFGGERLH
jgi:hypothetical protein